QSGGTWRVTTQAAREIRGDRTQRPRCRARRGPAMTATAADYVWLHAAGAQPGQRPMKSAFAGRYPASRPADDQVRRVGGGPEVGAEAGIEQRGQLEQIVQASCEVRPQERLVVSDPVAQLVQAPHS